METYIAEREFVYTPEQMFDLVADVEQYADFLPGWVDTRILRSDGEVVYVDQEIGLGPFGTRFTSQALFNRPEHIDITSIDGPFRHFNVRWTFERANQEGCLARFHASFELRSGFLQKVMARFFGDLMPRVVAAFELRARRLYAHNPTAQN